MFKKSFKKYLKKEETQKILKKINQLHKIVILKIQEK